MLQSSIDSLFLSTREHPTLEDKENYARAVQDISYFFTSYEKFDKLRYPTTAFSEQKSIDVIASLISPEYLPVFHHGAKAVVKSLQGKSYYPSQVIEESTFKTVLQAIAKEDEEYLLARRNNTWCVSGSQHNYNDLVNELLKRRIEEVRISVPNIKKVIPIEKKKYSSFTRLLASVLSSDHQEKYGVQERDRAKSAGIEALASIGLFLTIPHPPTQLVLSTAVLAESIYRYMHKEESVKSYLLHPLLMPFIDKHPSYDVLLNPLAQPYFFEDAVINTINNPEEPIINRVRLNNNRQKITHLTANTDGSIDLFRVFVPSDVDAQQISKEEHLKEYIKNRDHIFCLHRKIDEHKNIIEEELC